MTALNPVFTIERQLVEVILTHRRIPAAAARARALGSPDAECRSASPSAA